MARLVNTEASSQLCIKLTTVFDSGKQTDRTFKVGDIIKDLRYVKDNQVLTVSGRLSAINYAMNSKLTWSKNNPVDTFAKDITIKSLELDTSTAFNSSSVTVPINEIVEWEFEKNVSRMKYSPAIVYVLKMAYTDGSVEHVNVRIGGVYEAHIINPSAQTDITKQFTVTAFGYKTVSSRYQITSIVFQDINGATTVADIDCILRLTDLYSVESRNIDTLSDAVNNSLNGETILVGNDIDCKDKILDIMDKSDLTVNLADYFIKVYNSENSRVKIANSTVVFLGNGVIKSVYPFDETHDYGALEIQDNAHVIFNGSGIYSTIENDPKKYGQFGIALKGNANLTINEGKFDAGFYCIAGNAVTTNEGAVVIINGGELTSAKDYAIYQCYNGKLIVNDGKITGGTAGICLGGGYAKITGGNIVGTGILEDEEIANGVSNAALSIHPIFGDVAIVITGGVFISSHGQAIEVVPGLRYTYNIKINGGYFSSKPNPEWIMEGFACSDEPNASGLYYVYQI